MTRMWNKLLSDPATILLGVSLIVLLVGLVWGASANRWWIYALSIVAFVFLLAFAHLDKIQSVKASSPGVQAELVLREAKDTVSELKGLAKVVGAATLTLLQAQGRFGGAISDARKEELRSSILELLSRLKLTDEELNAVQTDWWRFTHADYVFAIRGNQLPKALSGAQLDAWQALGRFDLRNPPTPEQLENFFRNAGHLTPEISGWIDDYRFYIDHGEHRRPEVWANRANWKPFE